MAAYTRTMGFRQWACRLCVTVLVTLLGLSRALEDQYTGIRNSMGYQDSRSWSGSLMKTAEIKGGKELNSTRVNVLAGRVKVGIVHNSSKDTHPSPKEDLAMLISGGASYGRQLEDRTVQTPMAHISEPPSEHRGDLVGVLQRCLKQAGKSGLPGAAAGVLQVLMFMWLRTVVNYQCRYGTSIFAAVAELYRQGGILRFYRGVSFALVANPLSRFGMAAANEGALALRDALPHSLSLTVSTWIASLFAGLWRVILTPLDTCKTVLQVEGQKGFRQLMKKVAGGNIACLYEGALAASAATAVGYFPWFLTFNHLNRMLKIPPTILRKLLRNAGIGLAASVASDMCSNSIRVLKTTKQAVAAYDAEITYRQAAVMVLEADGWAGLLGRGLTARILANGLQSMLFTVVWRYLHERYVAPRQQGVSESPGGSKIRAP